MEVLFLILLVAALLCFVLAAFGVVSRVNLVALGLAFWTLVPLIQMVRKV